MEEDAGIHQTTKGIQNEIIIYYICMLSGEIALKNNHYYY